MMANFTFRIDDEVAAQMKDYKVNWSEVARQAVMQVLEDQRRRNLRLSGFSWRTVRGKNCKITVNAKSSEIGPVDWTLEIQSNEIKEPLIVELGGMIMFEGAIRGVADYHNHQALRMKRIDISKILSKDALMDLWLELVRWARKKNVEISGNVALLPYESIKVKGDEVKPKKWEEVRKDEDQINVFFSNFYVGSYARTEGPVFRLSSYLTRALNKGVSLKAATRYIDLYPDNQQDEEEIKNLFSKTEVIYLPDISVRNVRSVFFES